MRFSLGFSGSDLIQTLSRWGAELRSAFVLGDEDLEPKLWGFELENVSTSTPGVVFSGLDIVFAQYLHVGKICLWSLHFSLQGSSDFATIKVPGPPPLIAGLNNGKRSPHASGSISYLRSSVFTSNVIGVPILNYASAEDVTFSFICPFGCYFYTAGGTLPSTIIGNGFYFTQHHPER